MASIHPRKLANGEVSYRVLFRIDGKQRQESFLDARGAEEFRRLVHRVGGDPARRVLEARREHVGVPTLREWTHTYLDAASGHLTGIEPGTRSDYVRIAGRTFLPIIGDTPVDAIEKADVGRWIEWQERQPSTARAGQPIAAKTVRNYHADRPSPTRLPASSASSSVSRVPPECSAVSPSERPSSLRGSGSSPIRHRDAGRIPSALTLSACDRLRPSALRVI
ncbi:hypothetical protein [Agrococcus sediminis]|uniref:hypothetical protein n=1 Tax=Agrococcus sediminis TaxID=2599924 RepID=UPI00341D6E4C